MTLFSTAKIHIKIDVDKLFFLHSENLVAYHGHGYRHQGRDDVEEAVGQVGERGDMQHQRLRHAAGVPRHKDRGDRSGVFG